LSSTQKTGVFSETQIAAKPEELEPWEWSHSTALTTLIMVLLLFFSRRYFNISNRQDTWTSGCSKNHQNGIQN
jgi:hypothetical protein